MSAYEEREMRPENVGPPDTGFAKPETPGKSSGELERDIEATRARMGQDIDELSEKLRPGHLAQSAVQSVGQRARRTGSRMGGFFRENAGPMAAIGIGVSWLVAQQRSNRGVSGDRMARYAYQGSERRISRYQDRRGLGARVGRVASEARESVSNVAGTVADRAGEVVGRAQERVGELGSEARERMQELGSRAQEQTRRVRSGFERTLEDNPLVIAAGAGVLGLALGLLLPGTRREDEMLGPVRDRLADRAEETVERVKEAAVDAAQEVKETAQAEIAERGPELKETVQDMGRRVTGKAKESAAKVKDEAKRAVKNTDTEYE
jgi:ElaB/YqjD/DUF883 family membrane-anchored ribosome-binding protein